MQIRITLGIPESEMRMRVLENTKNPEMKSDWDTDSGNDRAQIT